MDARRAARAPHRHDHARCAPVAARDAAAHHRHDGDRAVLREPPAAAVLGGVLGRGDLRCGDALPARGSVAAPRAACASGCRTCCCRCCCAGRTRSATPTIRTTWCASSSRAPPQRGIDVFRIFDSLNWVENMRVSIDAVREAGKLCEAAHLLHGKLKRPARAQVHARLLPELARELKAAGTHVLGIKDMAGLVRPRAAYTLVKALKEEIGLPVHFHTHDTSGIAAASVLAAVDAGADAVDGGHRCDERAHLAAEPRARWSRRCVTGRATRGIDPDKLRLISAYWEQVRRQYAAFESDIRAGRLRGVRARHARRAVHQPARAGARARYR